MFLAGKRLGVTKRSMSVPIKQRKCHHKETNPRYHPLLSAFF
jgi:hypothetical protein